LIKQVIGAIILLNQSSSGNYSLGKNILLGGLVVQVVTFAFFITIAVHFDITVGKTGKWRWLMTALYVASALILVIDLIETIFSLHLK
jgi:hypothetical protein